MKLNLPFPPSVNTYWRAPNKGPLAGRHLISENGRKFRSNAAASVIEQLRRLPKPLMGDLSVNVVLFPPNKAPRDLDNYLKALFDAMTHAHVWEDDIQIKHMEVSWGPVQKNGGVSLTIKQFIGGGEQ